MSVLGIGDSHDSGAALFGNGKPEGAVNEERFTKRKNEVGFPSHSIRYLQGKNEGDIRAVALAWIGGNALISRIVPSWDQRRRSIWRKEVPKQSRLSMHASNIAYKLIQNQRPRSLWKLVGSGIGKTITRRRLRLISSELSSKRIYTVEHHLAHASSAYYPSGFKEALVITLDGAGDGLSGTVSIGDNGNIERLVEFNASASLGILYGAATVACDMRYSEDEGKLMSLAAYSYPKKIPELGDICRYDKEKRQLVSRTGTRNELLLSEYMRDHILSRNDRESFAYAVQAHVSDQVVGIVRQWVKETGIHNVAVSGGFFSNVITNMHIEHMPEVKSLFVFPHMGDGGIPFGAAAYVDFMLNGKLSKEQISDIYTGPSYTDGEILESLKAVKRRSISYELIKDPSKYGAELIADNKILLWFQGAMEYGPRALGNRSVLALPSDSENRNRINLAIKERPYYQPFASSVLASEAKRLFSDYLSQNKFMTGANHVRDAHYGKMIAASHIDHTTRPQILGNENRIYHELIENVKKRTGTGALLNTSLNKHGRPMVMSPEDAIWTLENTGADTLIMGNYIIKKR
jgi:carbamoyltransferase